MSVSTEEAEECARGQDSIEEASKFLGYRSIANRCAATLRSLAAERDALKAEIEKLRAENAKLAASTHAYLSDYQEAADEIEKLRAALRDLLTPQTPASFAGAMKRARAALGEKE